MTSGVETPNISSYKLNVTFHEDHLKQTAESGETTIWRKEKELGKGGFGSVRLERGVFGGAESVRAVKRILRASSTTNNLYIQREVKALIMVQDVRMSFELFGAGTDVPKAPGFICQVFRMVRR